MSEPKLIVVTAPEDYTKQFGVKVFLAGGITNCPNWQKDVIDLLKKKFYAKKHYGEDLGDGENPGNLIVFNPRRENFPIHDPSAAQAQIEWEFNWLEKMDIFSMYFSSGESDQPICMYELGRNLCRMNNRFADLRERIVITAENGYRRRADVVIQTKLSTNIDVPTFLDDTPYETYIESHVDRILESYTHVNQMLEEYSRLISKL